MGRGGEKWRTLPTSPALWIGGSTWVEVTLPLATITLYWEDTELLDWRPPEVVEVVEGVEVVHPPFSFRVEKLEGPPRWVEGVKLRGPAFTSRQYSARSCTWGVGC